MKVFVLIPFYFHHFEFLKEFLNSVEVIMLNVISFKKKSVGSILNRSDNYVSMNGYQFDKISEVSEVFQNSVICRLRNFVLSIHGGDKIKAF